MKKTDIGLIESDRLTFQTSLEIRLLLLELCFVYEHALYEIVNGELPNNFMWNHIKNYFKPDCIKAVKKVFRDSKSNCYDRQSKSVNFVNFTSKSTFGEMQMIFTSLKDAIRVKAFKDYFSLGESLGHFTAIVDVVRDLRNKLAHEDIACKISLWNHIKTPQTKKTMPKKYKGLSKKEQIIMLYMVICKNLKIDDKINEIRVFFPKDKKITHKNKNSV